MRAGIHHFFYAIAAGFITLAGFASAQTVYDVEIVKAYPHDPDAFTQGLFIEDGVLYESTGQYGYSSLRRVDLETGAVKNETALPADVFGEGVAPWGDKIVGLTWRSGAGFVFDRKNLRLKKQFAYPGEGWGLTEDGARLIMSDGTPDLRFLDPETLEEINRVRVLYRGKPLPNLNELEWIDGAVLANVWKQDAIVRIDPETGEVTGIIDGRPLRAALGEEHGRAEVLNGIAVDRETGRLFVTGKYWPKLFEIRLVERKPAN